ncbi:MAG TPA: HIT domain-containing protein [bacterium]|nr:HIT domain-containing protein [bacterium]HPJ71873.1 HIT domain-containing protein [bacterium]HPQ66210.1 HIT domain-containing protein [bacterium]
MERIWAPWRSEYVGGEDGTGECFFCAKAASGDDRGAHVLWRGKVSFCLLNRYPYNSGHLMIAPYRHTGDFAGLTSEESAEILETARRMVQALGEAMRPQGFNIGFNLGKAAGAGVVDHLHLHLVPRWEGDTNFMPVLASTRVMPQSLDEVFVLLRRALETGDEAGG